ncbi:hypothetical protein HELRODRAFT_172813 [Helobdella robusta]|uniref:Uncharacterized protein n=1 Tax=Helobdella robusta TaxID=6412 RepID=T1F5Y8_HELRO|nr:hypothetical protein HELRODRAFT_172813 [Helobdella robusta]ESO04423.1 hypothetical protein HELRODRAFT_172813 [Helobdella robusta]
MRDFLLLFKEEFYSDVNYYKLANRLHQLEIISEKDKLAMQKNENNSFLTMQLVQACHLLHLTSFFLNISCYLPIAPFLVCITFIYDYIISSSSFRFMEDVVQTSIKKIANHYLFDIVCRKCYLKDLLDALSFSGSYELAKKMLKERKGLKETVNKLLELPDDFQLQNYPDNLTTPIRNKFANSNVTEFKANITIHGDGNTVVLSPSPQVQSTDLLLDQRKQDGYNDGHDNNESLYTVRSTDSDIVAYHSTDQSDILMVNGVHDDSNVQEGEVSIVTSRSIGGNDITANSQAANLPHEIIDSQTLGISLRSSLQVTDDNLSSEETTVKSFY